MIKKHTKYTPEWVREVKTLIPKTEKGNDKSVIEKLVGERSEFDSQKQRLQVIKSQADEYEKMVYDKEVQITVIYPKWQKFYDTATTGWNDGVNSNGWKPRIKNWVENITGNDNICKGKILKDTLGASADTDIEITEAEAIALLSRALKAFEGINASDFETKKGTANKDGVSPTNAKKYLDRIQNQARHLAKNKSFGRDGYDLGYTYCGYDDTNKKPLDSPLFNHRIKWSNLRALAKFINEGDWTDKLDHTNFGTQISWNIYPQGDQYTAEELKNFAGDIANTVKYYKTGYKNKVLQTPTVVKMKTIKDWAKLVLVLDNNAWTKISTSQPSGNDNIYQKLFGDLRDQNTFTETKGFSINAIDKDKAKIAKKMLIQKASQLSLEYDSKRDEVDRKKTAKETEIQTLINEKLKELRDSLTTHNLDKGFEDKTQDTPAGLDNRKTELEIRVILKTLKDIRFLEKDDESSLSSEDKENTAFTELETLKSEFDSSLVISFNLVEGDTNADKCKKIKETTQDLQVYHDDYEKWEKKIKFSELQKKQLADIKVALGKEEDSTETIKAYQDKLKALDPILTETVITQAIVNDWKTQTNFKTSETMETELKKIFKDNKLDEDFKKAMTKEDAEITDVANLLTKKKADKVIALIRRWEYDKKPQTEKDKLVKVIKMNMNKEPGEANPTEEEITTGLYKLAVSQYSMKSDSEISTWENARDNPPQTQDPKGHLAKYWGWYAVAGILLATITGIVIWQWEAIKSWWNSDVERDNNIDDE